MIPYKFTPLFIPLIITIFLSGCKVDIGGESGNESNDTSSNIPIGNITTGDSYGSSLNSNVRADYNVTVADEAIVGAKLLATAYVNINGLNYRISVCDSFTDIGGGKYTLNNCIKNPEYIFAYGGFIDENGNGSLDNNESTQFSPLILNMGSQSLQHDSTNYLLSPVTTLVSEVNRATTNSFINKMGYNASNITSTASFFAINNGNKLLRHALNALFNSCADNGINIQKFSPKFIAHVNDSSYSGYEAIKDTLNKITANPSDYEAEFGKSQIQSFLNDRRTQSILTGDDHTILAELFAKKTTVNKIRIFGLVNTYLKGNNTINGATVNLYVNSNTTPIATAISDQYGKYNFEIDESSLPKGATLILVAQKNGVKLTSSIKSDALLGLRINNMLNPTILPDLAINYVTTLAALRINSTQNGTTSPKLVFDGTGYSNKNTVNEKYFIPIPMLYEARVLPWGANTEINTSFLTKYAKSLPASSIPYVLDLESWNFGGSTESSDVTLSKMTKYITVIDTMKTARPDLKFGYFGLLPQLSIMTPYFKEDNITYMSSVIEGMNARYDVTKELANHVDVLFPELYTYWPESKSNAFTGRVNIGISVYGIKYKKPIIPFLWPAYSENVREIPSGEYLSDNYWALEFSTLWNNEHVSGIAIWGGKDYTTTAHTQQVWDENLHWWQYTKQYIQ